MHVSRLPMAVLAASLLLFTSSCKEDPLGPNLGSGDELEATVNGTSLTLDLGSDIANFNTYTPSTKEVRFGGTDVGTPTKTMTIRFNYDIDQGPFPRTLQGSDVSIIYIETSPTDTLTYDCPIAGGTCSITVTGSNGEIVAGTFQATLSESDDPNKKVSITNGSFSVKLRRQ